jgi:hypothetical protein
MSPTKKCGHVICGLQILFIYFGYQAPAIRWLQTQNGGWVEACSKTCYVKSRKIIAIVSQNWL